jgi:hypothetical protein
MHVYEEITRIGGTYMRHRHTCHILPMFSIIFGMAIATINPKPINSIMGFLRMSPYDKVGRGYSEGYITSMHKIHMYDLMHHIYDARGTKILYIYIQSYNIYIYICIYESVVKMCLNSR